MTYQESIQFLYTQLPQYQRDGSSAYKPGLQTIQCLDQWNGRPHRRYPCLHVAGTNGKGSVSHLMASVLQAAGYRVGLFTSPHLKDFRERIRVNGECIEEAFVCQFVEDYLQHGPTNCAPSFFELTTEMAFGYFAECEVDVAIIEVGLGGRLDSTNIICPVLSMITSISFDHTALLGHTLEAIALEKAGIIKPSVPVVLGHNPACVQSVVAEKAKQMQAAYHYAEDIFSIKGREHSCGRVLQVNRGEELLFSELECELGGDYIDENAAVVLCALDLLSERFPLINHRAIYEGFASVVKRTSLHGRWEIIHEHPRCICDTGHNEAGIQSVCQQLLRQHYKQLRIVLGMVNDKDVASVLAILPKNALYYFTKASIPRALDEHDLAQQAAAFGLVGSCYATVSAAYQSALHEAHPDDLVFVGGSNFVVAEVI